MAGYFDAFNKNGYRAVTRGDVSDCNDKGVVVAIMTSDLRFEKAIGTSYFDSREIPNWYEERSHKTGNRHRIVHLKTCLDKFDGRIDVILFDPLNAKDTAEFWTRRDSYWKLVFFEEQTGHHRIQLFKS